MKSILDSKQHRLCRNFKAKVLLHIILTFVLVSTLYIGNFTKCDGMVEILEKF